MLRYGGDQYLVNAWAGLKRGHISLDVPIAIGIAVLFLRSAFEIISGSGAGYLDSLAGLIFFLLLGRWFQSLTYERLSFDRDHKDYFPVAAYRKLPSGEIEPICVEELIPGERIIVRPGQLIPADGKLLNTSASPIDYSFVTGEAQAQYRSRGEIVYAGGRAVDHALEIELSRKAAESYLLQLWREQGNTSEDDATVQTSERLSKYFTLSVLSIALLTLLFWLRIDANIAFQAATAVLIIACPCALALTAPFAYGSMMRFFGKAGFFLRSANVLNALQDVDTFVFDKTGTLVEEGINDVCQTTQAADQESLAIILAMSLQSDHPRSQSIGKQLRHLGIQPARIGSVVEAIGRGLLYQTESESYRIGSAEFCAIEATSPATYARTTKNILLEMHHDRVDLRGEIEQTLEDIPLQQRHLLSGDHPNTESFWAKYFAPEQLHFLQSPFDKEAYVEKLQSSGQRSLMLGDGLNDSGALKAASVGLAVTEDLARFSPACDGIVLSSELGKLTKIITAARKLPLVLRSAYVLAIIYNLVGLSYAVTGQLSPVVAAILMPLSSITVVGFTVLATWWQCRKIG
jgi:Cu+-exporting ATPase